MTTLPKITFAPTRLALASALALAVPAALVLPVGPAIAQSSKLDQAVGAVRAIETMKADFVQTDRDGRSLRGTLTIKRPGRIRFEYERGVDMLIVSDGNRVTFVDYQVGQKDSWALRNSPLGPLLDPNRDIKRYGQILRTSNPNVLSIRVEDKRKPEFGVMTLILVRDASAPGGWELSSWVALDAQNKRTTVRLSNQRYGMAVPESTFTYREPVRTSRRGG
jgi:outer membrane lipoprotein-sorting protein